MRSGQSVGFPNTAGGGGNSRVLVLSGGVAGSMCVGNRAPGNVLAGVALAVGHGGELAEVNEIITGGGYGVVSRFPQRSSANCKV